MLSQCLELNCIGSSKYWSPFKSEILHQSEFGEDVHVCCTARRKATAQWFLRDHFCLSSCAFLFVLLTFAFWLISRFLQFDDTTRACTPPDVWCPCLRLYKPLPHSSKKLNFTTPSSFLLFNSSCRIQLWAAALCLLLSSLASDPFEEDAPLNPCPFLLHFSNPCFMSSFRCEHTQNYSAFGTTCECIVWLLLGYDQLAIFRDWVRDGISFCCGQEYQRILVLDFGWLTVLHMMPNLYLSASSSGVCARLCICVCVCSFRHWLGVNRRLHACACEKRRICFAIINFCLLQERLHHGSLSTPG